MKVGDIVKSKGNSTTVYKVIEVLESFGEVVVQVYNSPFGGKGVYKTDASLFYKV